MVDELSNPNSKPAGMILVVEAVYTQFKSSLLQPLAASHTVPVWPPTAIVTINRIRTEKWRLQKLHNNWRKEIIGVQKHIKEVTNQEQPMNKPVFLKLVKLHLFVWYCDVHPALPASPCTWWDGSIIENLYQQYMFRLLCLSLWRIQPAGPYLRLLPDKILPPRLGPSFPTPPICVQPLGQCDRHFTQNSPSQLPGEGSWKQNGKNWNSSAST